MPMRSGRWRQLKIVLAILPRLGIVIDEPNQPMHKTITKTALILALISGKAWAYEAKMPALLDLVAGIESSHNPKAIGDSGLARGEFQFHRAAWQQVSDLRTKQGRVAYPYGDAHNREVAKGYAEDYLTIIAKSLTAKMGRKPKAWEIYAAFNRGVGGFKALGYRFDNLPSHTKRSCTKIATTLGETL